MSRIFVVLAIVSLTLVAANLLIGFSISGWPDVAKEIRTAHQAIDSLQKKETSATDPDEKKSRAAETAGARVQAEELFTASKPLRSRVLFHMLLGVGAGIGVVLVNSITVTYFVGTSRWCKEVVDTYQLDQVHVQRCNVLKRLTFPWAVAGMLMAVVMVALGGAADPGNNLTDPTHWVTWHRTGAMFGIVFIGLSFWNQFNNILANYLLINRVMAEVQKIRQQRGLET